MDLVKCANLSSAHPIQDQTNPGDIVINIFLTLFATIEILTITTNVVFLLSLLCSKLQRSKPPDSNKTKTNTLTKMLMTSLACSDTMLALFMMSLQLHELTSRGRWTLGSTLCALRIHVNNLLCNGFENQLRTQPEVELRIFRQNDTSIFPKPDGIMTLKYSTMNTEFQCTNIEVTQKSRVLLNDGRCNLQEEQCANPAHRQTPNVDVSIANTGADCSSVVPLEKQIPECVMRKLVENSPRQTPELATASGPVPAVRNLKAFRTIGYVMATFTLCWLPSWLSVGVFTSRQIFMPIWLLWTMTLVAYVSSALNPVLYCCNRSIKRAVVALFKVNTH
ncbi:beta-1 adrenergic receptor-like [Physella acuta]|uniref:beta-1 adrenergic receptor-like n=1 Tax=Physella acuta TaxID=109671 RepID=UPI0027DD86A4|nr:beta-1 adrenergic receptor-like [Physella acuta]